VGSRKEVEREKEEGRKKKGEGNGTSVGGLRVMGRGERICGGEFRGGNF
jgi:hypothetical protein